MSLVAKILIVSKSGNTEKATVTIRQCIEKRPKLISFIGKDCRALEDICDEISDELDIFVATTSHPDEPIDVAIAMVRIYERDEVGEQLEIIEI